jgi:transcriptional regulator with XRE-family HTH domain
LNDVRHFSLAKRLKDLRSASGLTQETVAELASLSYKHYQSLEAGRKPDIRLSSLMQIAEAYGIEGWELLHPENPRPKISSAKVQRRKTV